MRLYRIRIVLDTEEDILRDIEIESTGTLEELHDAITQAFMLDGSEMASFYTVDNEWNQEDEIPLFDMDDAGGFSMSTSRMEQILTKDTPRLLYVYDFLAMWTFYIELVEIAEPAEGESYPRVLFSQGELPDEAPERAFKADEQPEDEFSDEDTDDYDLYDDEDFNDANFY